ncbi:MAG: neutral zinc metallopeptidase [Propionibacteriaceae bacterium]|nr:neutral zinc metallopeptidase [Propionibacteriaceae bacterium]
MAGVILVILLFQAFSSQPGDDTVSSNYQNEDYVVPGADQAVSRIPVPQYEAEIAQWLQDNTLYQQSLAEPVRCDVDPIRNLGSMSDVALQTRMRGYVECLTRVWGPALEAAGHEAYQPTLYVYPAGGEVKTSCGTQPSLNAFYCGADQNLYLAADVLRILPAQQATAPEAFDLIIAHEYGHAMQGRSGVFAASHFLGEDATSTSVASEVSRMVEVQADCFAGSAMNSIAESMGMGEAGRESVARISYEIGDDRLAERFNQEIEEGDHGTGVNRRLWAERGLAGGQLSKCNTFVAPSSELR